MRNGLRRLSYGAAGLIALAALVFIWGFAVEPRLLLDEHYEEVEIPGLPPSWENQKVALIADLQMGLWCDNGRAARQAVRKAIESRPALILLAGDFVYHSSADTRREIILTRALLRPLAESGVPVVAVLGNEDYAMRKPTDRPDVRRAEKIREALESIGITVMANDAIALSRNTDFDFGPPVPASPLYIVGIGPRWPHRDRVALALKKVPAGAPRIVLMHHPDSFGSLPAYSAPLAVAGYTHGGQVRIPFAPEWTWMSYDPEDRIHSAGWIPDAGREGNRLYVNRGIGCSIAPIRINCTPELTFFILKHAPDGMDHRLPAAPSPLMDDVWIKVDRRLPYSERSRPGS